MKIILYFILKLFSENKNRSGVFFGYAQCNNNTN